MIHVRYYTEATFRKMPVILFSTGDTEKTANGAMAKLTDTGYDQQVWNTPGKPIHQSPFDLLKLLVL